MSPWFQMSEGEKRFFKASSICIFKLFLYWMYFLCAQSQKHFQFLQKTVILIKCEMYINQREVGRPEKKKIHICQRYLKFTGKQLKFVWLNKRTRRLMTRNWHSQKCIFWALEKMRGICGRLNIVMKMHYHTPTKGIIYTTSQ